MFQFLSQEVFLHFRGSINRYGIWPFFEDSYILIDLKYC